MVSGSNLAEDISMPPEIKGTNEPKPLKGRDLPDPLKQVLHRKTVRQHIHEFAASFALILALIAVYVLYVHNSLVNCGALVATGAALLALGYLAPRTLRHVWECWMKLVEGLGLVMTTLLLSIVWFLMFIPMSALLRLLGKKMMNMNFRQPCTSYWTDKDEADSDFKLLERQY